ncbi:MAG: DUF4421 family protein, partial [Spirochaetota bacterium]
SSAEETIRENAHLRYLPDFRTDAGFGIYYKWFGIDYSRNVFNISDRFSGSKTECTDFRGYFYLRKISADCAYLDYKGFRLTSPLSHGVASGSTGAVRKDMTYRHYSANLYYIFSDDFSLAAAFKQTERQKSWDWSLMMMISGIQYSIDSRYSLIPQDDDPAFGDNAGFESGIFRGIAAGPGFGFTVPWKNFFLTSAAFFGSGYMRKEYRTSEGDQFHHDGFYRINVKASAGYNGDSFFYGTAFYYDGTGNYSGIRIVNNAYTFELYTGLRL